MCRAVPKIRRWQGIRGKLLLSSLKGVGVPREEKAGAKAQRVCGTAGTADPGAGHPKAGFLVNEELNVWGQKPVAHSHAFSLEMT